MLILSPFPIFFWICWEEMIDFVSPGFEPLAVYALAEGFTTFSCVWQRLALRFPLCCNHTHRCGCLTMVMAPEDVVGIK